MVKDEQRIRSYKDFKDLHFWILQKSIIQMAHGSMNGNRGILALRAKCKIKVSHISGINNHCIKVSQALRQARA